MWKKRNCKKLLCLILSLFCLLQVNPAEIFASEYWPEGPAVESPSVIIMETTTGAILYEKNSLDVHYPASITKILTTLVALENSDLNEVVTFSDRAIDETIGSGIARDYGEQMTMEQCLYAVMLASANECAFAVAEHVGGTMENFVEMMNAKAKEIGCVNTQFANPHGLHDENHYTCSYDMALIARAAYQNETFRIITGTSRYTIPPTNKHEEQTDLQNHNEMLCQFKMRSNKYVYSYCTGGKTGHTDAANSTLVTFAEKDGMTFVCVVMNAQSPSQWEDSINLYNYVFDNFQLFNIADNETRFDSSNKTETGSLNNNGAFVDIDKKANIVLPKTADFLDTTSEITYDNTSDSVIGTLTYTYAGHQVGGADILKTGEEVEEFTFDNQKEVNFEEKEEEIATVQIKPYMIFLIVLGGILLCLLIIFVKKFMDNYYIIRHNMEVKKNRRQQTGRDRNRNRRKGRRRHRH